MPRMSSDVRCLRSLKNERERQTERQTDRQTEKQTDREKDEEEGVWTEINTRKTFQAVGEACMDIF